MNSNYIPKVYQKFVEKLQRMSNEEIQNFIQREYDGITYHDKNNYAQRELNSREK